MMYTASAILTCSSQFASPAFVLPLVGGSLVVLVVVVDVVVVFVEVIVVVVVALQETFFL